MSEFEFLCSLRESDLTEDTLEALMYLFRKMEKLEESIKWCKELPEVE
jgi:hypothetical protein